MIIGDNMDLKEIVDFLKNKGVSKINISLEFKDNLDTAGTVVVEETQGTKNLAIPDEMLNGTF